MKSAFGAKVEEVAIVGGENVWGAHARVALGKEGSK